MNFPYFCTPKTKQRYGNGAKEKRMKELGGNFGIRSGKN